MSLQQVVVTVAGAGAFTSLAYREYAKSARKLGEKPSMRGFLRALKEITEMVARATRKPVRDVDIFEETYGKWYYVSNWWPEGDIWGPFSSSGLARKHHDKNYPGRARIAVHEFDPNRMAYRGAYEDKAGRARDPARVNPSTPRTSRTPSRSRRVPSPKRHPRSHR